MLTVALLFIPLVHTYADPVDEALAMKVAECHFGITPTKSGGTGLSIVWNGLEATKAAEAAPFYVITRDGGGFIIVAGDDNVTPVLAFSDENEFVVDGMPAHVAWVMEQIAHYCRSSQSQSPEVREAWRSLTSGGTAANKVSGIYSGSRTGQWHQYDPFNNKAPYKSGDSGDRCVTGCVPLAAAEILAWHKAPTQGDGSSFTIYRKIDNGVEACGTNTLNTEYDWDKIHNIDSANDAKKAGDELCNNLAQLILDCGTVVEASYGKSTSATTSDVAEAFALHMGYNKAAHFEYPQEYTKDEWRTMLKEEIEKRPVLYSGRTENDSGHAFVADGYATYQGNYVFHFNFGWGSSYNGYYYDFSHPDIDGDDYSVSQYALFDFYPSTEGDWKKILHLKTTSYGKKGLYLYSGSTPMKKGSNISIGYGNIDMTCQTYQGKIQLCLEDKDGNIKQVISTSVNKNWDNKHYYSEVSSGTINVDVDFGDRIALYFSTDDAGTNFERIRYAKDGSVTGVYPCCPAAFIKQKSSYSKNESFELALVNHSYPYNSTYYSTTWTFIDPSGNKKSYDTSAESVVLNKSGEWTVTATIKDLSDNTTIDTIITTIIVN